MYRNSDALIRPELSAVFEEAAATDSYFIGLQVFPIYSSEKKTGNFLKITKAASELMKKDVTIRAPKGAYGQVDRTYEKDSFSVTDRGIEEVLDDSVTAELTDYFPTEAVTSKLLLRSIMLDLETRVAAKLFDSGTFDAVNSMVAYSEVNLATFDFILDATEAVKRVKKRGELVNTMVMNRDVFDRVRRSAKVASFLFGPLGGGKQVTPQDLAGAIGVPTLLIADATIDASAKGKTATPTYIWSNNFIWIGNIQGGEFTAGGAGRTIIWTGDAASIFVTETYRREDIRSDVIRVRTHSDEKVISAPAGTLIATQWA